MPGLSMSGDAVCRKVVMQFTKAEEYGMQGVLHLADKGQGKVTPLSEIAEAREIPEKFLAKIFQALSRSGILRSHRGVRGGFTLAKAPCDVTVKDVLESIQGPYHLAKCIPDPDSCPRVSQCAIRDLLATAEKQLLDVFTSHTLEDLVRLERAKQTETPAKVAH